MFRRPVQYLMCIKFTFLPRVLLLLYKPARVGEMVLVSVRSRWEVRSEGFYFTYCTICTVCIFCDTHVVLLPLYKATQAYTKGINEVILCGGVSWSKHNSTKIMKYWGAQCIFVTRSQLSTIFLDVTQLFPSGSSINISSVVILPVICIRSTFICM